MSNVAVIQVSNPPRGGGTQDALTFHARSCVITGTWGLQPGTALIDWASIAQQPSPIIPGAFVTIKCGGHTFYGGSLLSESKLSDDGHGVMMEFADLRYFLQSDIVYCAFNLRDHRLENGVYVRRYRHLLPGNYNANLWTITPAPLSAAIIIGYLFSAPTVESPWQWLFPDDVQRASTQPVYDLDFTSGRKLGEAVMTVSEKVGMTFTTQGAPYRLIWTIKGVGNLPNFPPNSTDRKIGTRVTGNPTRVRIIGDRNLYQVLNVPMVPDWLPAWQSFWDLDALTFDLYEHERDEHGAFYALTGMTGYLRAAERARRITVAEYAWLRDARSSDGNQFRDFRKIAGRSRMNMPAALYVQYLVFRAFRLPPNFSMTLWNGLTVGAASVEIVEQALAEVVHDPVTGVMDYTAEVLTGGNGYAIARGYQVGQDNYKTLRPEHFDPSAWQDGQDIWQHLGFSVDASGAGDQFILMDDAVIRTPDLLTKPVINGLTQRYALMNAAATMSVAPVRAALTLAGERWSYIAGTGWQDAVEAVPGLAGQFVVSQPTSSPGLFQWVEVPYADGDTATRKSADITVTLLNRPSYNATGGYRVQGSNITQLSAMIERVTLRFSDSGLEEEVEFANERVHQADANGDLTLERPRDFERRMQMEPLLPGQAQLREEANARALERQILSRDPKLRKAVADAFYQFMGWDVPPAPTLVTDAAGVLPASLPAVPAGTPYWRPAAGKLPMAPGSSVTKPVFVGASVWQADRGKAPRLSPTGIGQVIFVRVQGPANSGDLVGVKGSATKDYLEKLDQTAKAETPEAKVEGTIVGMLLDTNTAAVIFVAQVRLGAPGSGGSGGGAEWYKVKDVRKHYYRCRTWDGATEGADYVYVARPTTNRCIPNETIDGITFTYTYADPLTRVSDFTMDGVFYEETQAIIPRFSNVLNTIYASQSKTALLTEAPDEVGLEITLVEEGAPRCWTAIFGSDLTVRDAANFIHVAAVRTIVVPDGSLVDNGGGKVTLKNV